MPVVTLARNPLAPETWTTHDVDDVRDFLMSQFATWPDSARIYHTQVSVDNDVTPEDEAGIGRLGNLPGPLYVVVYPAGGVVRAIIKPITFVLGVITGLLLTKPPTPSLRNTNSTSPNNELSDRVNTSRPLARIPDIFGQVRSTPDLLAVPLKVFIDHEEVEYAYMCIGRGAYDVTDVRDGETTIGNIPGASVAIYAPGGNPNNGAAPQLLIGAPISRPVTTVTRSNSVYGQTLRPPNDVRVKGKNNIYFVGPNEIKTDDEASDTDFAIFVAGDFLTISNSTAVTYTVSETRSIEADSDGSFRFLSATIPAQYYVGAFIRLTGAFFIAGPYYLDGQYTIESLQLDTIGPDTFCRVFLVAPEEVNPQWAAATFGTFVDTRITLSAEVVEYNLDGTYEVLAVSSNTIVLDNPVSVNADWGVIGTTAKGSPLLVVSGDKWVGPFDLDLTGTTALVTNFYAAQGMYKDDGRDQDPAEATLELEATPINAAGDPIGPAQTAQVEILGSKIFKGSRAATLDMLLNVSGRVRVRARRVTETDLDFDGSVVDEVKWRDLYATAALPGGIDFGDVTTAYAVTFGAAGALVLKERRLNALVTRKLPQRISGSTFTTELYATKSAADIISAACLDPRIGNRTADEINFDNIYDTVADVVAYFGHEHAGEFSYTFDSDNLSFEETIQSMAQSAFCTAYRRGNIINLSFERETTDSVLLFNHRNKLPGSETRTVRFGNAENFDGVAYTYIDPEDDAIITRYLPADQSAINAQDVESIGVRTHLQAYWLANRIWNMIRYQNTATEFTATQEADILARNDRILVADNTRPETQDGEVMAQNGLDLTLSQPVAFAAGVAYTMFLQHFDGTVQAIAITAGATANHVTLAAAPSMPLALDPALYARTGYIIVGDNEPRGTAFLVSDKSSQRNFTTKVTAINYDDRYYANDLDYISGNIDEEANLTTTGWGEAWGVAWGQS